MSNKDYREQSLMFFQNFAVDTNTISLSSHEQVCLGGLRMNTEQTSKNIFRYLLLIFELFPSKIVTLTTNSMMS